MELSLFDYSLKKENVAQYPLLERDSSKMLVLHRKTGRIEHRIFKDIYEYLMPGELLLLNNTKVMPVRLHGKKTTGGKVEILLVKKRDKNSWVVLTKGIRKGKVIFSNFSSAYIDSINGTKIAVFSGMIVEDLIKTIGEIPVPPYIKRNYLESDRHDYQTVFAQKEGAIAAPTAGLHFTKKLIEKIKNKGVQVKVITLHVGQGTFKPILSSVVENHKMDEEFYHIPNETALSFMKTKATGKRVIAVGTTVTRTLESAYSESQLISGVGKSSIFIYPGYHFKAIDALITNFHLPKSSPMVLAAAFANLELIKMAYSEAQKKNYRFFSYGDAMFIL